MAFIQFPFLVILDPILVDQFPLHGYNARNGKPDPNCVTTPNTLKVSRLIVEFLNFLITS